MKVAAAAADLLGKRLATVCPPGRMKLGSIDIFRGPAPPAPVAAVICEVHAGSDLPALSLIRRRLHVLLPDLAADHDEIQTSDSPPDAETLAALLGALTAALLGRALRLRLASGAQVRDPDMAVAWFEYFLEQPGMEALSAALVAVGSAITGTDGRDAVRIIIERLTRASEATRPSFQALFKIEAARRRGIPFFRIANSWAIWQFGWGRNSMHFWTTSSNADGLVGNSLSHDKDATKRLFRQLGLPTPAWLRLGPGDDARGAPEIVGWPCVVKPLAGGSGKGVTANIRDLPTLEQAAALARTYGRDILVEAHQPGDDHRLMVVDGRLAAAIRRDAPVVVGDGISDIRMLIDELNRSRRERSTEIVRLLVVKADAALTLALATQNLTLDTVLAQGRRVVLRTNSNISTGGTPTDVTAQVHPQIRGFAEQLTAAAGLRTAGIDYITPDISRNHDEVGGGFIETNTTAGIDVVLLGGMDADELGAALLGERPGRIPVSLVLAPTEARTMIADRIAERLAAGTAAVTADWARIGEFRVPGPKRDPVGRVEAVLRYPSVESMAIVWTFDDLCNFGLPVDRLDTIVLVAATPSIQWHDLLRTRSKRLQLVDDPSEAVALILGPAMSG